MTIHLHSLVSTLHDAASLDAALAPFVGAIEEAPPGTLLRTSETSVPEGDLLIVHVMTGGVEGLFRERFAGREGPLLLLASGVHNALPASLEIAEWARSEARQVEILHGSAARVASRLVVLERVQRARASLDGLRLGVIGRPSDWLVASEVSPVVVRERLGIELVEVEQAELMEEYRGAQGSSVQHSRRHELSRLVTGEQAQETLDGSLAVYGALAALVTRHRLDGFTLRCFEQVVEERTTACLALALLNSEGVLAGCEGDVPAMLSMAVLRALTGRSAFQANPSRVDPVLGEVILAHCTVALDVPESFELDTHFESGLGLGVRGKVPPGPATLFKLAADCERWFVSDGDILEMPPDARLCRTQVRLRMEDDAGYFLRAALANHHVLALGRHAEAVTELMTLLGITQRVS